MLCSNRMFGRPGEMGSDRFQGSFDNELKSFSFVAFGSQRAARKGRVPSDVAAGHVGRRVVGPLSRADAMVARRREGKQTPNAILNESSGFANE